MVNLELIHAQNPDCFWVGGMYLLDSKANAIFQGGNFLYGES